MFFRLLLLVANRFSAEKSGVFATKVYKMIRIVYNTHVAMKSGLKGDKCQNTWNTSCTPYRDEKRTESTMCLSLCDEKCGLKEFRVPLFCLFLDPFKRILVSAKDG